MYVCMYVCMFAIKLQLFLDLKMRIRGRKFETESRDELQRSSRMECM